MLPKYFGKLLTNELIQKINNSIGYFLLISIDYGCNNLLMIHNDSINCFPLSANIMNLKFICLLRVNQLKTAYHYHLFVKFINAKGIK